MSIRLISSLLLATVVATVMWAQYRQLAVQKELITMHETTTADLLANVDALISANEDSSQLMLSLMQSQQRIQQNLTTRQTEIRRLQIDVEEIRAWADRPLPDAVVRMRQRPALIGSEAHSALMPTSDAMSVDSIESKDKRRSQSAD